MGLRGEAGVGELPEDQLQGQGKQYSVLGQLLLCSGSSKLVLVPTLPPTCCVTLSKSQPSLNLNIFL